MKLVFYYSLFALFAIVGNFLAQEISLYIYNKSPYSLWLSIFVGTFTGLFIKFYLDKKYIFKFKSSTNIHNLQIFILYSIVGGSMTIFFWGIEFGFFYFFKSDIMKYIGGFIGLIFGYILKFFFDKKFVFKG